MTGAGILSACSVFGMSLYGDGHVEGSYNPRFDSVTLPGGARHGGSDCPVGAELEPGLTVWRSDAVQQGNPGDVGSDDNGCGAQGTCGLPFSEPGLGGGWQICFE